MKIFKTRDQLTQAVSAHYELQFLILQRFSDLSDESLEEVAHFYVVECAADLDTLPQLPEFKTEHLHWIEYVYVISDDGFGLEVFVPKGLI